MSIRESEKRRLTQADLFENVGKHVGAFYKACLHQLGEIGGIAIDDVKWAEWGNPTLKWLFATALLVMMYRYFSTGRGADATQMGLPGGNRRPLWERIQGRGT